MQKITARDLLKYDPFDFFKLIENDLEGKKFPTYFTIVFDNGQELETTSRHTSFSLFAWKMFKFFPETQILPKHHLTSVLGKKKYITPTTHTDVINTIFWDVYAMYINRFPHHNLQDILSILTYRFTNEMYNVFATRLQRYVTTASIFDMIEVIRHPAVMEKKLNTQPNQHSLRLTKKFITNLFDTSPDFDNNPNIREWRAGIIKRDQYYQCVGLREYLTDVSGHLFWRCPVMTNFGEGIFLAVESAVEARSSSKSLEASSKQIKRTEYFNRRIQLLCQILQRLHHGDCGTKRYMEVRMSEKDFDLFIGVNYLDEETGIIRPIRSTDVQLYNRKLKLRVPHYCAHKDSYGVCSTCLGEISKSIPEHTNIGWLMATILARIISQSVLSTKHLDANAESNRFKIHDSIKHLIGLDEDGVSLYLKKELKHRKPKLVINQKEAPNLPDVLGVENVESLGITRISELEAVGLILDDETQIPLTVSQLKRMSSLSHQMLAYVHEHKWDLTPNGSYIIDLKDWDWDDEETMFILPLVQVNMTDHADAIAKLIESSTKHKEERARDGNVDGYVMKLFDLVNTKLRISFMTLAVIAYTTMIRSAAKKDYGLPKPWTEYGIGVKQSTFDNRASSSGLAFERLHSTIVSPGTYLNTVRPEHPMDFGFVPAEVVKAYKEHGIKTLPDKYVLDNRGYWEVDYIQ